MPPAWAAVAGDQNAVSPCKELLNTRLLDCLDVRLVLARSTATALEGVLEDRWDDLLADLLFSSDSASCSCWIHSLYRSNTTICQRQPEFAL